MSLIHLGCDQGTPAVHKLYHHVKIENPGGIASIVSESAPGTIRYEVFLECAEEVGAFHFGIPYPSVIDIEDATRSLRLNSEERLLGETRGDVIENDGTEYTIYPFEDNEQSITSERLHELEYTVVSFETDEQFAGHIACGIEIRVDDLAINVASSLIQESTWALDLTLYGPVQPREHLFLSAQTDIPHTVLPVEQAYSYLYLPNNAFPRTVSPTPLESFYYGSEANFYYTWVCGQLDPWYEQRMLVTYGSYNNNVVAALLVGILASFLVSVITGLTAIL